VSKVKPYLGPMRLPFVVLTPACVLAGIGTAVWTSGRVNPLQLVLVLVGAIASHIAVNAFNEYFDFKSGLDARTMKAPFSGGSGVLPARPALARSALAIAWTACAIAAGVGLYFVVVRGWALLPLGIVGLFLTYAYTVWLTRNPFLCLVAPGLGFGVLMVMGTHFALTGQYTWGSFIASLVPFFLVSDLLLLNQFPDVEADRSVGRRHFPIVIGRPASALIYSAFLLLAYGSIVVGVLLKYLPKWGLLGLGTLPLALLAGQGAIRKADDLEGLAPYLGLNVLINILTPLLLGVGLLVG